MGFLRAPKPVRKTFPPATACFIFLLLFPLKAFSANTFPVIVSLTPASLTIQPNQAVNYTSLVSDADGWQNIQYVQFIINTGASGLRAFYGYYNQNTNKLYIRNDANTAYIGGYAPGSNNILQNSYVSLNCKLTSVSGSGYNLTVVWNLTFKDAFSNGLSKNCYLHVRDDSGGYVYWTQKGTIIISRPPTISSLSPVSTTIILPGQVTFTAVYGDADGNANLKNCYIYGDSSRLYASYDKTVNKLYLIDEAGSGFTGGYAPGSANVIQNTHVALHCANTSVSASGATVTIKWVFTLKEPLGPKVMAISLLAKDSAGISSGWVNKGDACLLLKPLQPSN